MMDPADEVTDTKKQVSRRLWWCPAVPSREEEIVGRWMCVAEEGPA